MKSREGKVVDADDILHDMVELASQKIKERYNDLSQNEIEERSRKIGHAALRFFILKYDMTADFTFDPDKSIEFEGETGPYIQYTYARTASIFKKAGRNLSDKFELSNPNWELYKEPTEEKLISKLGEFPEIVFEAVDKYKVHYIPKYLLELAQCYNEFYRDCPVLNSDNPQLKEHRLFLIKSFADIIKIGLNLMTIETLDTM
jgi:arginyl-tRNA synthetase